MKTFLKFYAYVTIKEYFISFFGKQYPTWQMKAEYTKK